MALYALLLYKAGPHRYNQTGNVYGNALHKKRWTLAQKNKVMHDFIDYLLKTRSLPDKGVGGNF